VGRGHRYRRVERILGVALVGLLRGWKHIHLAHRCRRRGIKHPVVVEGGGVGRERISRFEIFSMSGKRLLGDCRSPAKIAGTGAIWDEERLPVDCLCWTGILEGDPRKMPYTPKTPLFVQVEWITAATEMNKHREAVQFVAEDKECCMKMSKMFAFFWIEVDKSVTITRGVGLAVLGDGIHTTTRHHD
jgi:hypothetical protein